MKKSPLLSIFLIVFVDILGYTIILPLLPFFAEHLGATPFLIGLLIASYGFCQLIAGPILGRISDITGRRKVLLISQLGTLAGFLLLASARDLHTAFISRIIDGLTAGNLAVAQAYIADVTEPQNRARAFGLIGISFGLGFLIGPAISGALAHFGYQYPIYAAAFLSGVSILATFFLLPSASVVPSEKKFSFFETEVYKNLLSHSALSACLKEFFAFIFAFSILISGFALFAERRFVTAQGMPFGAKEVGYVFAYVGLIGVLIQAGAMGKLVKAFGEKALVRAGFLLMTLSFVFLGFASSVVFLLVILTFSFAGSSILRPSLTSLITQKAGKDRQGAVMGMTQSLMSFSQVIAPVISGILIQHRLLSLWAMLGAVSCLSGLIYSFRKSA